MTIRGLSKPRYIGLFKSGELADRVHILNAIYRSCTLCPHRCGVDRTAGAAGRCRTAAGAKVASAAIHTGEEPPISGTQGSGAIFFTGCTARCAFCQNYPISQLGTGSAVSPEQLADMMLSHQRRGCHNINLVTPTHVIPTAVEALFIAAERGLSIPIVYNTSGFESVETLRLLEDIVDIYLPDIKYADDRIASDLSGFPFYTFHNRAALAEMYRQAGNLRMHRGLATGGMIVRHLVLPDDLSGPADCMRFLANMSPRMRVSLMDQYFPAYQALTHPILSRRITDSEYEQAVESFHDAGLTHGWVQIHEK